MINHSNCDHPSTSGARAKCRRATNGGGTTKATPREVDMRDGTPTGKPQTPSNPALACDNCGVERIAYKGIDEVTGITKFVGPKCYYIVKRDPNTIPLD